MDTSRPPLDADRITPNCEQVEKRLVGQLRNILVADILPEKGLAF
jgi:hypothetical protein